MKLKTNSWYYKLHVITYEKMSYSLCNFFWEIVWAIIMFIPNVIWCFIPDLVGRIFGNDMYQEPFFSIRWGRALGFYFLAMVLYSLGCVFFLSFGLSARDENFFKIFGYLMWIAIIIAEVIYLCSLFLKKSNLLKEFIKAKKQKVCPRIEWVGESKSL